MEWFIGIMLCVVVLLLYFIMSVLDRLLLVLCELSCNLHTGINNVYARLGEIERGSHER